MPSLVVNGIKKVLLEVQDYFKLLGQIARGLTGRPIYFRDIVEQFQSRALYAEMMSLAKTANAVTLQINSG